MDLWKPPGFNVPSSWPLEGTHKILSLSLKSSSGYSVKGLKVLFRTQKWQHTVIFFFLLELELLCIKAVFVPPPTHTHSRIDGAVRPPAALHGLDQTLLNSFPNSTFFLMCLSLLSQQWCFTSLLLSSPLKCDFLSGFFFKENLQRHFCCISVSLDPFWSKPLTIRSYCLLDYLCLFLPSRCWRCPLGSFWPLCRGTLRLCCTVSSVRTAKHSSLHLRTPP